MFSAVPMLSRNASSSSRLRSSGHPARPASSSSSSVWSLRVGLSVALSSLTGGSSAAGGGAAACDVMRRPFIRTWRHGTASGPVAVTRTRMGHRAQPRQTGARRTTPLWSGVPHREGTAPRRGIVTPTDPGLNTHWSWQAPAMTGSSDDARPDETPTQRADRNWDELLQELRVAQTGVQVLTGFLLTLPFQARFTHLDAVQQATYLTAVVLGVVSIALLIAPLSSHRLLFHQ